MISTDGEFLDRREAGRRLAKELLKAGRVESVLLALPRGSVPVAFELAKAILAPLDVLLVRKLGTPGHPEFGAGAVVDGAGPQFVINEDALRRRTWSPDYLQEEKARQLREIERLHVRYVGWRPAIATEGRAAIVVDDGIATGNTAGVAHRAERREGCSQFRSPRKMPWKWCGRGRTRWVCRVCLSRFARSASTTWISSRFPTRRWSDFYMHLSTIW